MQPSLSKQQEQLQQRLQQQRHWYLITNTAGVCIILACSLGFGFGLQPDPSLPTTNHYNRVSAIVGWWVIDSIVSSGLLPPFRTTGIQLH